MTLETYSAARRCPKCRSSAVTTLYCAKQWGSFGISSGKYIEPCWRWGEYAPHMHRTCQNCSHLWYERPADANPANHTPAAIAQREQAAEDERIRLLKQIAATWPTTVALAKQDRSWWRP